MLFLAFFFYAVSGLAMAFWRLRKRLQRKPA
jgi:hypothetical protein